MPRFPLSRVLFVLTCMLLGACGSRYPAPVADLDETPRFIDSGRTHRVNAGETLVVVAWIYELDVAALARANNLSVTSTLTPGQILTVDLRGQPVASRPAQVGTATPTAAAVTTGIRRTPLESAPITRQSLPQSTPLPQNTAPAPANTAPPPATSTETPPPVARSEAAPVTRSEVPPPATATPPATTAPATPPPTAAPATNAPAVAASPTPPPATDPNAPIVWAWPGRGNVIGRFSESNPDDKGIKLGGSEGDTVMAAADGEVVYTGNGLLRYGELVIIKHSDRFLSAYAHNKVITVKEGERVARGHKIAELGSTGIDRDMLHFEIRLDGKPVDPMDYLPKR
jgi:lipoprotein NlpD